MVFFDSVDQPLGTGNWNILEHYSPISSGAVPHVFRTTGKSQYVLHWLNMKTVMKVALNLAVPIPKSLGISRGPLLVFPLRGLSLNQLLNHHCPKQPLRSWLLRKSMKWIFFFFLSLTHNLGSSSCVIEASRGNCNCSSL